MNIETLLSGVPFDSEQDRCNYIKLLDAAKKKSNGLFIIESNGQGCGKTHLARAALFVANNRECPVHVYSPINFVFNTEDHAVCFDNVKITVGDQSIEQAVDGTLAVRKLGSAQFNPVGKLVIITGNNVRLSEDLERRATRIRLDKSKMNIGFGFSMNAIAEAVREIP